MEGGHLIKFPITSYTALYSKEVVKMAVHCTQQVVLLEGY